MKPMEFRTVDKTKWGDGPWQNEPDKVQFEDPETGLPCLIVRNGAGNLCGYVGVSPDHPWHGKGYGEQVLPPPGWANGQTPEEKLRGVPLDVLVDVHGSITYAGGCDADAQPDRGICHVPEPGDADSVWWFGFDCAHYRDLSPGWDAWTRKSLIKEYGALPAWYRFEERIYRTVEFVRAECARLAQQLAEAAALSAISRS